MKRKPVAYAYLVLTAIAMALVVVVAAHGCAGSALNRAKTAGLVAKQTAESAYLTVRIEWELGHVSDETMDRARALYVRYVAAQRAYVALLAVWEASNTQPADLVAQRERVVALATALHALMLQIGPPPTTRPGTELAKGASRDRFN